MNYHMEIVSAIVATFLTLFSFIIKTTMKDLKFESRRTTKAIEELKDTIIQEKEVLINIHGALSMVLYELLRRGDMDKKTLDQFKKMFFVKEGTNDTY